MKIGTEAGFTLIESLIVFSIVLIISTAAIFSIRPMAASLLEKQFFSQLETDLLYAQAYAISHQKIVRVHIQPEKHMYYILRSGEEVLVERQYSKDIIIQKGSMDLYFSFLSNGNINQFGRFYIYQDEKAFSMTFLIGRGRFYVTEM
jgi:competence protein ComGD